MFIQILRINNITIKFHKVKAHADNILNNKCDQLAKAAISSDIIAIAAPQQCLNVIPTYNNFFIDTHLRHFVKDITTATGFIEFYKLQRNTKYRISHIDWLTTFQYINDDSPTTATSLRSSSLKARRIKFLLEELPTLEFLQHWKPQTYDSSWQCLACKADTETFNHIWLCPSHTPQMRQLINNTKTFIENICSKHITGYTRGNPTIKNFLTDPFLWSITSHHVTLTIIDLIKGVVPAFMTRTFRQLTNDKVIAQTIISIIMDYIHSQAYNHIWLPRCQHLLELEKAAKIHHKIKYQKTKDLKGIALRRSKYSMSNHQYKEKIEDEHQLISAAICSGSHWTLFGGVMTNYFLLLT